jgi:hypothetical protein
MQSICPGPSGLLLPITHLPPEQALICTQQAETEPGESSPEHSPVDTIHLHNLHKSMSYFPSAMPCQPVRSRAPSASMNVTLTQDLAFYRRWVTVGQGYCHVSNA